MLPVQTIIALIMFSVGLTSCFVTKVITFNRLRWLVEKGQLTDLVISYIGPMSDTLTIPGTWIPVKGTTATTFTELGGCISQYTLVFVLVVMILGVVQVISLHRTRLALCGKPGFWASRATLWISVILVHVLFFVQVALMAVFLLLDTLCPQHGNKFSVDAKQYCHSSGLRGGLWTTVDIATWTGVGYFLLQYALILMGSSLNAEFAVASAASAAWIPLHTASCSIA